RLYGVGGRGVVGGQATVGPRTGTGPPTVTTMCTHPTPPALADLADLADDPHLWGLYCDTQVRVELPGGWWAWDPAPVMPAGGPWPVQSPCLHVVSPCLPGENPRAAAPRARVADLARAVRAAGARPYLAVGASRTGTHAEQSIAAEGLTETQ